MISQTARLCILQLQLGRKKATQGFTMIEVLVGILITLAFTATAMQAMVAATSIKVRADEKSESSEWIKQDFEGVVRPAANNLNYDSSAETYPISSAATAHRDRCVATTSATGYASLLKTSLDAMTIPEKRSATGNRQYTLTRTTVASSVSQLFIQKWFQGLLWPVVKRQAVNVRRWQSFSKSHIFRDFAVSLRVSSIIDCNREP
jgi:type II secretory pathway pseudopilin PulG